MVERRKDKSHKMAAALDMKEVLMIGKHPNDDDVGYVSSLFSHAWMVPHTVAVVDTLC